MKRTKLLFIMSFLLACSTMNGCGRFQAFSIPYPDDYCIHIEDESTAMSNEIGEESESSDNNTSESEAAMEISDKKTRTSIQYFLDTSGSMKRSPNAINVHAAAVKCAAGYQERHYFAINELKELIETDEKRVLSGFYSSGSPIDILNQGDALPCDPAGVNIITTDLQSRTSCSQIGRWIAQTGSTGFSFYVFTMQYDGALEFEAYNAWGRPQRVSLSPLSFDTKEFLMIVFGENSQVKAFDEFFQSKLDDSITFDTCHASFKESAAPQPSLLQMHSSRCFNENMANITVDQIRIVYSNIGHILIETSA